MELTREQLEKFLKLTRTGLIMSFLLIIIMLFHVLIDFFYHT